MGSRRAFLRALLAGATGVAAAAVLPDPERLLWTPGEKTHFLPPAGGWSGVDYGWCGNDSFSTCLLPGDIFTLEGHYAVNPVTGKQTAYLQQYMAGPVNRAARTQDVTRVHDSVTGVSMRFHKEFDPPRYDILYGHRALAPDEKIRLAAKGLADQIDADILAQYKSLLDRLPEQYAKGMSEPITTDWFAYFGGNRA